MKRVNKQKFVVKGLYLSIKRHSSQKTAQLSLLFGGIWVCFIGIGHIFMPTLGYDRQVPMSMSKEVSEHFYYLGTYAICSFLISLGIISIYVSRLQQPGILKFFAGLFSFLWIGRTIMEVVYPVKLKLFFLSDPTSVLLPVISLIAINYSFGFLSLIYFNRNIKDK